MSEPSIGLFLEACGATEAFVLGVEDLATSNLSWRVFDQPYVVVGRDPRADLYLNNPQVSRRHVYMQLVAGRLFVVDLQSRTGTHWSGEPGSWGWVDRDPGITVGPFRIQPRADGSRDMSIGPPLPMPVSRNFDQARLPEVSLELAGTSTGSTTWRVDRSLVLVGSSQACKIRLQGGNISSIHASFLRTPAGCFVVDLLGKAGVVVNGQKVRSSRLETDDLVLLGPHQIRVRSASPRSSGHRIPLARPREPIVGASQPGRSLSHTPGRWQPVSGPAEDTPVLLRAMLDEFSQVQTQTSDRFQQSIVAILKSFATIHTEQMAMIREELDQIRRLNIEQQNLRSEIEKRNQQGVHAPALRLVTGGPDGEIGLRVPPPIRQVTPEPSNDRRLDLAIREGSKPGQVARPRPAGPDTPIKDNLHGQIIDRITQIQDERAGRWQKLLKSLLD